MSNLGPCGDPTFKESTYSKKIIRIVRLDTQQGLFSSFFRQNKIPQEGLFHLSPELAESQEDGAGEAAFERRGSNGAGGLGGSVGQGKRFFFGIAWEGDE